MMETIGLLAALQGVILGIDTLVWRQASMPDYLAYGMQFAQTRHEAFIAELAVSAVLILAGALAVAADRLTRRKCPDCGRPARRKQRFCTDCGKKLPGQEARRLVRNNLPEK